MPITAEQLVEVLGVDLEAYESPDAYRQAFNEQYLQRAEAANDKAVADQVFGKVNGMMRDRIAKAAKELGLDLEVGEQNPTDLIKALAEGAGTKLGRIKELEDQLSSAAPADAIKQWETKVQEAQRRAEAEEQAKKALEQKLKEIQDNAAKEGQAAKEKAFWDEVFGAVKFRKGLSPLLQDGFRAKVMADNPIHWDDKGQPYLADKDGVRVPHPKQAGQHLTHKEAAILAAKEAEIWDDNPHDGKRVERPGGGTKTVIKTDDTAQPRRAIHPDAAAAAAGGGE